MIKTYFRCGSGHTLVIGTEYAYTETTGTPGKLLSDKVSTFLHTHLLLNPVKQPIDVVGRRQAHWLLDFDAVSPEILVLQAGQGAGPKPSGPKGC